MLFGGSIAILSAGAALLAAQATAPAASIDMKDRAAIEAIVHDYILEHPEIIPQAVEKLQNKRTTDIVDKNRAAIETPYAGGWEGAANGDVVLVEFFDYACGYCRASLPVLAQLAAEDKALKIVYRELPILSDESGYAAKVSLLAAEQGRYMPFHRALYAAGRVDKASILAAAQIAGLDRGKALAAMADPRYDKEVENNIKLAQSLQASGTPTFVIGNQVLNGAVGYDTLKAAVAKARVK